MDLKLEDLKKSLGRMYSRIPRWLGGHVSSVSSSQLPLSSLDHHMPPFQPGCCRGECWRSSSEDSSVVPSAQEILLGIPIYFFWIGIKMTELLIILVCPYMGMYPYFDLIMSTECPKYNIF